MDNTKTKGIYFEKVSLKEFKKAYHKEYEGVIKSGIQSGILTNDGLNSTIKKIYDNISLPKRATVESAGYDFQMPYTLFSEKGCECIIPTGIRAHMPKDMVLKIYPRSSLGFKNGLRLLNTVGIIDSDYYHSDNEGHIMIKITHDIGKYRMELKQGQGIAQGIFQRYYTTDDDSVNAVRNGGLGSTDI